MKKGTALINFILAIFTIITLLMCSRLELGSTATHTNVIYLYSSLLILSSLVCLANVSYYLYKKDILILALAVKFAISSGLWFTALVNSFSRRNSLAIVAANRGFSEETLISNLIIACIILGSNIRRNSNLMIATKRIIEIMISCAFFGSFLYFLDYNWLETIHVHNELSVPFYLSLILILFNFIIMYFLYKDYRKSGSIYVYTICIRYYFTIIAEICRINRGVFVNDFMYLSNIYDIISYSVPVTGICCEFIIKIKVLNMKIEEERIYQNKLMKYYSIIESIGNLIAIVDENNNPEYLNPAFKRLLNFYNKKNYSEMKFDFKGSSSYKDIFDKAIKNHGVAVKTIVNDVKGKKFYDMSVYPIKNEFTGENTFVMLLSDETDNILLTKHLVNSERKFRNITNNISDLICQLDKSGKITYCSPSYTKMFGGLYQDYIGVSWIHNIRENYIMQVIDDINSCVKHRDTVTNQCEMIVDSLSQKCIWVEYVISPLNGADYNNGVILSARDITRRKNAEEEKERESKKLQDTIEYDKVKTEFFSNISHELRTPINVIFSILQVTELQNNSTEDYFKKYNKPLKQNCYRLLRLINNLIDITKIDSGFLKLTISRYDIVSLIENMTQSVVPYAEAKGLSLVFDTYEEEKMVYCDPDKVERIILNLLSNAIKFTPRGGRIIVTISIDEEKNNVVISVKDNGVGIPGDMIEEVFERFRQVDKSLTRQNEGSGIGLSLVKSLVELHKGTIELKSKVGEGSEFIINLPIDANKDQCSNINIIQRGNSNIETINVEFSDIYE